MGRTPCWQRACDRQRLFTPRRTRKWKARPEIRTRLKSYLYKHLSLGDDVTHDYCIYIIPSPWSCLLMPPCLPLNSIWHVYYYYFINLMSPFSVVHICMCLAVTTWDEITYPWAHPWRQILLSVVVIAFSSSSRCACWFEWVWPPLAHMTEGLVPSFVELFGKC